MTRIDPRVKFDVTSPAWPDRWDWWDHVEKGVVEKAWTEVKNSGLFWKSLFPYTTSWDDIKKLNSIRRDHDIYFLTKRFGKTAKAETEEWLYGHGYMNATVILCDEKPEFCDACNIDILIDDRPENLNVFFGGMVEYSWKCYLFKRPYNIEYWHKMNSVTTVREALADALQ